MGILFGKKKEEKNKKPLIIDEFDNLNDKNEEGINKLCLKVHIIGSGDKKNFIINSIFKQEITDNNLKNKFKVTRQFKTEQFHWIAHIYEDGLLTDDICKEMENEIKADRKDKENENIILKNQVVLCFGNENTEMISSYFKKLRKSNMIFITETECKLSEKIDKRYAKNIIYKDLKNNEEMSNEELNIKVISLLWELDCFFKEKGNLICRYTPDNIFNGLENENSLFTLNILVIGLSRVGKSTFINLISRKLTALESDLTVSVTKNISEYYIYHKDGKNGHGAIKLIDTPGIVNNKSEEDYKKKENQIKELIRNQGKNFEKKIHFIFVILLDTSKISFKDANNVKEIFEVLNESKCPVYFIINKIRKNIKKADLNKITTPLKETLNKNGFNNLSKDENFIPANFLKGEKGEVHGIDTIFQKMANHINEKKYLDEKLLLEMRNLLKDFRATVEGNKSFIALSDEDKSTIDELKKEINFSTKMEEINKNIQNNEFFSKLDINTLISNGRVSASKCLKVIMSLSNLKGVLPSISQNIPAISIYQAVMVKEIGSGYGLDIDILNSGTNRLIKFMRALPKMEKEGKNQNKNEINKINIEEFKDVIQRKAKDKLKASNNDRNTVLSLADILNRIRKMNGEKKENDEKENIEFSESVYEYCKLFFEREIRESQGLCFMVNYFSKLQSLMDDIKYYIEKNDWENYEMLKIN